MAVDDTVAVHVGLVDSVDVEVPVFVGVTVRDDVDVDEGVLVALDVDAAVKLFDGVWPNDSDALLVPVPVLLGVVVDVAVVVADGEGVREGVAVDVADGAYSVMGTAWIMRPDSVALPTGEP